MIFRRLVGQAVARRILGRMVENGQVPTTLMLEGPPGVGKALALWEWTQALFCTSEDRPCGTCRACEQVARLTHPDFVLVSPENLERFPGETSLRPFPYNPSREKIPVEAIREIRTLHGPVNAPFKVVGIVNAEEMTLEAQNAFLKTLEEPPSRTVFVLVASQPEKVLPTIRSRAFPVRFGPLSREEFDRVMKEQGYAGREVLYRASGGSPGLARELSGQGILQARTKFLELLLGKVPDFLGWVLDEIPRWKPRDMELRILVWGQMILDAWAVISGGEPLYHPDVFQKVRPEAFAVGPHHLMQAMERLPFLERAIIRNLGALDLVIALVEALLPTDFRDTLVGLRRSPVPDDGLGVVSLLEG